MLDLKTASTIATSIVHAKLDYCNSLFLNIDLTQIIRLQAIQNALARVVTKTHKHHITPVFKKLHWLKVPERKEYKVISLTYNTLQCSQPSYLRQLFTIQPPRSTRSSTTLTLSTPPFCYLVTEIFQSLHSHALPPLWNKLPPALRQISESSYELTQTSLLKISPRLFHSKLETLLFSKSYPDLSSSSYLPPRLNSKHHLTVCLPDSLDLDRCLSILFWLSACE